MTKGIAFVAGATGFTGREVVRLAVQQGLRVVAHVRPNSSRLDEWRERFSAQGAEVDTTAWDEQALRARFAQLKPTMVFALLGTTRARAKVDKRETGEDSSYETVDFGLTAMLIGAAETLGNAPRFVYLSSAGVGRSEPSGAYMHARWKVEQLLERSALPHTIARPSFITGVRDDRRPGERVGSALADGALTVMGVFGGRKLRDRYRSTSNTILAGALVRLALDPAAACAVVESEDLR